MKIYIKATISAIALACAMSTNAAEDTINLRFGGFLPVTNTGVIHGDQILIDEVARLTGGRVNIEYYPAQQAGGAREALDLVRNGAIDMYSVGTAYFSGDVPLWGLLEAPNLVKSVCDGTHAMHDIGSPGGILWEFQYKQLGFRVLQHQVYPPYGPSASHVEITGVESLQGLKMRNAGGMMERTVAALGAIPVSLTAPEVLQGLERGTLDSWMGAYSSVRDYEYYKFAKNGATGFSMGTPGIFTIISEAKFQSLPEDIQQALIDAGIKAEDEFCSFMDQDERAAIKELQSPEFGMKIYRWTAEDVAAMDEMTSAVVSEWMGSLESRGVPAEQAMLDYKASLAAQ